MLLILVFHRQQLNGYFKDHKEEFGKLKHILSGDFLGDVIFD